MPLHFPCSVIVSLFSTSTTNWMQRRWSISSKLQSIIISNLYFEVRLKSYSKSAVVETTTRRTLRWSANHQSLRVGSDWEPHESSETVGMCFWQPIHQLLVHRIVVRRSRSSLDSNSKRCSTRFSPWTTLIHTLYYSSQFSYLWFVCRPSSSICWFNE